MIRRTLAALSLLLLALVPGTGPASAATSYTNPIKSQKGADPWLQWHDGNYYLITTSFSNTLVVRRSPTLGGLNTAPSIQVWQDTTSSRGTNFWAPELHQFNGRWYIYYSAGAVGTACCDSQRTHVLESAGSDPLGPYTYRNMLTGSNLTPGGWLIDASPMSLNGSLYLLGSGFIAGSQQSLVIAPMSNPYTVSGAFTRISSPTHSWETQGGTVNEAPVALHRGGQTFVVYSASACWGPDYKLGQLTHNGGNPLSASSWVKKSTPVFQRSGSVYGPGHHGFFTSPNGAENWIVYHANSSSGGGCDNNRTTRAQKFTWNSDGTPNFGTPVATGTSLPAPAGETAATPAAYTLVNRNSGKCLEVAGGGTGDGVNIQQWTCNGSAGQRWRVEDQADDTSRLVNVASGKVADVTDCASADGTDIRQWSWLNNTCQRFRLVYTASGGWVRIVNAATGKVADVADCGTADGADVRLWSWLNNNCQQWSVRPA